MPLAKYDKEVYTLRNRRTALLSEVSRIDKAISALTGRQDKSWSVKALDCLTQWDEFITTVDILNCMFTGREEELNEPGKRKTYTVALSVALNKLVKKGAVVKIELSGFKGNYYGLPSWVEVCVPIGKYYTKLQERTFGRFEIKNEKEQPI